VRNRASLARGLAAVGALLVWAALALQFHLLVGKIGGLAVWRFLGYFTILTNILVAVTLTSAALRRGRGAARFELAVATAVAIVGIVYSLLLRQIWDPQGADKLADALLHDVAPALCVVWFGLAPRRRLGWVDGAAALIFPLLYVLYALARGAADGWYAYWFLDPRQLGAAQMALNIAGLTLAFLAVAAVLAFVSNRLNAGDGALSQG
jgi:hypothetical protein